jgi:hypothetical protein
VTVAVLALRNHPTLQRNNHATLHVTEQSRNLATQQSRNLTMQQSRNLQRAQQLRNLFCLVPKKVPIQRLRDSTVNVPSGDNGFYLSIYPIACQNVFVMQSREIVPCSWCKVRKYNFDMIERFNNNNVVNNGDSNDKASHFCSVNCLKMFTIG